MDSIVKPARPPLVTRALNRARRALGTDQSSYEARELVRWMKRADDFAHSYPRVAPLTPGTAEPNPLRDFFQARKRGPGIWKWDHYFEIYHRHFQKFRGQEVHIVEIGIYSGGSLDMWREYFGPGCHIYGVDIAPECKTYERDNVRVFIGDQADRDFWRRFRDEVPTIDIVVDDGGHAPEQQQISMECLLPYLRPGGVYLCEDIHNCENHFGSYIAGMCRQMNTFENAQDNPGDPAARLVADVSAMQSAIDSVHVYPLVTVVERGNGRPAKFIAAKQGTEWQPYLR